MRARTPESVVSGSHSLSPATNPLERPQYSFLSALLCVKQVSGQREIPVPWAPRLNLASPRAESREAEPARSGRSRQTAGEELPEGKEPDEHHGGARHGARDGDEAENPVPETPAVPKARDEQTEETAFLRAVRCLPVAVVELRNLTRD